jgi:hypothetical protein
VFEHAHLVGVVHHGGQAVAGDLGQFAFLEEAFEQQDAARVVAVADLQCGIEFEQCQAVGIFQRGQYSRQAVAVGIGLDHRQYLRLGRLGAHERQVAAQRAQVDLGKHGPRHRISPVVAYKTGLSRQPLGRASAPCDRGVVKSWYKTAGSHEY